ncbi:MAG: tetratricopeptide repeat protein, partial [Actinomycetes bacterium]
MGRLLRPALVTATALALAVAFTLVAAIVLGGSGAQNDPGTDASRVRAAGRGAPATDIESLQARLRTTPRDHRAWSTLALAYVEQARVTADPTYYSRADEAVDRSARLAPGDSVMLTARASLAAARHDFTAALRAVDKAIAANGYSAAAHAIRSDALTELGRYGPARRAAHRADNLEPGPATFARLSYAAELRGDLPEAARLMRLSRDAAGSSAATYAFAAFHLGELARTTGDMAAAAGHYAAALDADP